VRRHSRRCRRSSVEHGPTRRQVTHSSTLCYRLNTVQLLLFA
jgi:hypothetical protein